mmetsp:Transcript_5771/g.17179  ORF Transcript_5771/g.17179 Transcript_5771/m.17179 type:complete len:323 (+) Transcript_5771:413-1381(+)
MTSRRSRGTIGSARSLRGSRRRVTCCSGSSSTRFGRRRRSSATTTARRRRTPATLLRSTARRSRRTRRPKTPTPRGCGTTGTSTWNTYGMWSASARRRLSCASSRTNACSPRSDLRRRRQSATRRARLWSAQSTWRWRSLPTSGPGASSRRLRTARRRSRSASTPCGRRCSTSRSASGKRGSSSPSRASTPSRTPTGRRRARRWRSARARTRRTCSCGRRNMPRSRRRGSAARSKSSTTRKRTSSSHSRSRCASRRTAAGRRSRRTDARRRRTQRTTEWQRKWNGACGRRRVARPSSTRGSLRTTHASSRSRSERACSTKIT